MTDRPPLYETTEPMTEERIRDIEGRLFGGDAEGIPAHLAELLFTDLPDALAGVRELRSTGISQEHLDAFDDWLDQMHPGSEDRIFSDTERTNWETMRSLRKLLADELALRGIPTTSQYAAGRGFHSDDFTTGAA